MQNPDQPVHRPAAQLSRNSPCPCGSGRKYKRCCRPSDQAAHDRGGMDAAGVVTNPLEGIERAARITGRSVDEVAAHLEAAAAAGWLRIERDGGDEITQIVATVPADDPLAAEWAGATEAELRQGHRNPRHGAD